MNTLMKELTKKKENFLLEEKNTEFYKKLQQAKEQTLKTKMIVKTAQGKKVIVTTTIAAIAITTIMTNVNLNKDIKLYGQEKQNHYQTETIAKNEEVKVKEINVVGEKLASSMYSPIKGVEYTENEKGELVFENTTKKYVHSPLKGEIVEVNENGIKIKDKEKNIISIQGLNTEKRIGDKIEVLQVLGEAKDNIKMSIQNQKGKILKGAEKTISKKMTETAKYGNFVNLEKPSLKISSDEDIIRIEEKNEIKKIIDAMPQKYKDSSVVRNLEVPSIRVAKALAETSEAFYYDGLLKPHLLEYLNVGEMTPEVKKIADMILEELKIQDKNPEFSNLKYKPTHFYETLVLLMKHESGENPEILAKDPMQSSAYAYGEMGIMNDPQFSVESGVECFLTYAKELGVLQGESDIRVAFQGYNYGKGYYERLKDLDSTFNLSEIKEVSVPLRAEKVARGNTPQKVSAEFRDKDEKYAYGDYTYAALIMKTFNFGMTNEELAEIDKKEMQKMISEEKSENKKAIEEIKKQELNNHKSEKTKEKVQKETTHKNPSFTKEEIYVNEGDVVEVSFNNKSIKLEEIDFNLLSTDEAVAVVKELKKGGKYKNIKNNFLETTLKKINSEKLNEYLTGNYQNKRLDFLTENALAIAELEKMPKELKEVLEAEKEGKKITEIEGKKFQVNAKLDVSYIENVKKEMEETYKSVTIPLPKANLEGLVLGLDYGHAIKSGRYSADPGAGSIIGDGATGDVENFSEAQKVYEVGKKLKKQLEAMGATVIESHPDGSHQYKVDERSTYLNKQGVDMIISIHYNGDDDPTTNYSMVALGKHAKPQDKSLGEKIMKYQGKALPNVETSTYTKEDASIGIVRASNAKLGAVVLEAGFITSLQGAMIANSEVAQLSMINGWINAIAEQYGTLGKSGTPKAAKKVYKEHLEEVATKLDKKVEEIISEDDELKNEIFESESEPKEKTEITPQEEKAESKVTNEDESKITNEEVKENLEVETEETEEVTDEEEEIKNEDEEENFFGKVKNLFQKESEKEELEDSEVLEQALSYFN